MFPRDQIQELASVKSVIHKKRFLGEWIFTRRSDKKSIGIFEILKNKPSRSTCEFQQSRKWQKFGIFVNFSIFTQF